MVALSVAFIPILRYPSGVAPRPGDLHPSEHVAPFSLSHLNKKRQVKEAEN